MSETAIEQILIAKLQDYFPVKCKAPLLSQKVNSFYEMVDAIANLQAFFELKNNLCPQPLMYH